MPDEPLFTPREGFRYRWWRDERLVESLSEIGAVAAFAAVALLYAVYLAGL